MVYRMFFTLDKFNTAIQPDIIGGWWLKSNIPDFEHMIIIALASHLQAPAFLIVIIGYHSYWSTNNYIYYSSILYVVTAIDQLEMVIVKCGVSIQLNPLKDAILSILLFPFPLSLPSLLFSLPWTWRRGKERGPPHVTLIQPLSALNRFDYNKTL